MRETYPHWEDCIRRDWPITGERVKDRKMETVGREDITRKVRNENKKSKPSSPLTCREMSSEEQLLAPAFCLLNIICQL